MSMPRRGADDLADQRQDALAGGHRDDGAELERDQPDGAHERGVARGAAGLRGGVGGDDGVDDQLADVGDERRQRGGGHRQHRQRDDAGGGGLPHEAQRAARSGGRWRRRARPG